MKYLIVLLGLFFTLNACQTGSSYQMAINESRALIDSLQQAQHIPGIDIAISIDGQIVWSEAFGFADLEHVAPVQAGKTRFRIGSVSKPLTTAAMGLLTDQNKLDISKTVQDYVPYFPQKQWPVTVEQVAGHIGGIRHYRVDEWLSSLPYKTVRMGLEIFKNDSLLFEPGSRFQYSSYGYNLLSAVVEGASGESFLPYIQKSVFDPLGMSFTTADRNDSIIVHRSSFYQISEDSVIQNAPYVDNSYKWAGGGFLSSTHDLIKFGQAFMAPGFFSEKTFKKWITPLQLSNGDSTTYGIGWQTHEDAGLKGYGHGGGSVGGITHFKIYPDAKLVIVILSNASHTQYGQIPNRIVKRFLQTGS